MAFRHLAPWVPQMLTGPCDSSNFEEFEDEDPVADPYKDDGVAWDGDF